MLHALIMAGGSGTRFWPRSRRHRPKQLIRLFGARSLIQQTLDRVESIIPPERVLVVTGRDQAGAVAEQLPELPPGHIVGEPCPRDTAPCVGLAAARIVAEDPEATMVVLSADHRIEPPAAFCQAVLAAAEEVENDPTAFVVFGIRPTRAETGYGYIERAETLGHRRNLAIDRVVRFKEKPDLETARAYLASGRYLWNAGIFVWKARAVLDAIRAYQPDLAESLDRLAKTFGTPAEADALAVEFPKMPRKPIDRAVMEHHTNVKVIESQYEWSDVGDWRSLAELLPKDDRGNVAEGRTLLVDTSNSVVISDGDHLVATLGLDEVVVIQSGHATLVARKDQLDQLKALVESLGPAGYTDVL
jgi:mannose-1-phosphate guanylyltransferase